MLLNLKTAEKQDQLHEEVTDYQTLPSSAITDRIWGEVALEDEERGAKFQWIQMDLVWGHLAGMIKPVSGRARFSLLSQVAKLVLTLPYSNADSERVFSIIRHDKQGREALQLEGTLTSLVAVLLARSDTSNNPGSNPKGCCEKIKVCNI